MRIHELGQGKFIYAVLTMAVLHGRELTNSPVGLGVALGPRASLGNGITIGKQGEISGRKAPTFL